MWLKMKAKFEPINKENPGLKISKNYLINISQKIFSDSTSFASNGFFLSDNPK
jgi:hypothetical protein